MPSNKPKRDRDTPVDSSVEHIARTMALAAGHDPDERVLRDGAKPWPRWCEFRSAALEQSGIVRAAAAQQASASAGVVAGAQPEAHRDRPLVLFGDHEPQVLEQMRRCMSVGRVVGGVICADGHLGYAQPVGAVVAYDGQISISGVGFDIGCGNMAVRLDTPYEAVRNHVPQLLADIRRVISFGVGRMNEERVENALFDDAAAWAASGMADYRAKAERQLGTVGGGNHYVDLLRDEQDLVWIGVHFGSRGLGHTAATRHIKLAGGPDGIHVPPAVVEVDSSLGYQYLAAMQLAGRYAYAGREWVVERVRQIIGGAVIDSVHNHHNFAWPEIHNERALWVVRKGATPAFPGQRGFVGGSMGDDAVIVAGVDSAAARQALFSTVHGAGRTMSRTAAKRTYTHQQMHDWLQEREVFLAGGDLDESPMAYRRLPDVLAQQGYTIDVQHRLRPFAVAMAGPGEHDPFKD